MLIRWVPWEQVAGDGAASPAGAGACRSAASPAGGRRPVAALWIAAAVCELLVLRPALAGPRRAGPGPPGGLRAGRRLVRRLRPRRLAAAPRQPQRGADDRHGLRVLHLPAAVADRRAARGDAGELFVDLWSVLFVMLLLTLLTGGRLRLPRSTGCSSSPSSSRCSSSSSPGCCSTRRSRTTSCCLPGSRDRRRDRHAAALHPDRGVRGHRRRARRALVGRLRAAPPGAAADARGLVRAC